MVFELWISIDTNSVQTGGRWKINIFDVYPADLIDAVADKLKADGSLQPPEQAKFWKITEKIFAEEF